MRVRGEGQIPGVLRGLRRERGWTLQQLADRCGFSVSLLSNWENGVHTPRIDNLVRVLAAFGGVLMVEFAAGQPQLKEDDDGL